MNPPPGEHALELDEAELAAWDLAWQRVESHLGALGIRNKLVLSRKVAEVMRRAEERWQADRGASPAGLAGQIIDELVTDWLRAVLELPEADQREVSRRGRLSLLLVDMPGQWQHAFLSPPPWPEALVRALRERYPSTGPEFRESQMEVRPVDLGTLPKLADRALRGLEAVPRLRTALLWLAVLGLAALLFYFSR